jgi:uncharacterized spore protein YtfJ
MIMNPDPQPFQPIEHLIESLNANAVFGTPTEAENVTIIPVARVTMGFGYGFGSGGDAAPESTDAPSASAKSEMGGGGGGGGGATPIGFIRVSSDGVEFEPTVDVRRLGLAGIMLAGWIVFWIAQCILAMRRGK